MNAWEAVLLGIVQGLTEFLPISSSGHLVLFQNLLGFTEPELLFDICLHVGTLVAVCAVFVREIFAILSTLVQLPIRLKTEGGLGNLYRSDDQVRMAALIVVGSIPTAILGLAFKEIADHLFSAIWIVGVMLLITGSLLWFTGRLNPVGRPLNKVGAKDALLIGLTQGLAILPGISRSGSTISVALYLGIDRTIAGRYSFLLSIPAILGALAVSIDASAFQTSISMAIILFGTVAATATGYLALKLLLLVVHHGKLFRFAPYCWVVGLLALGWSFI